MLTRNDVHLYLMYYYYNNLLHRHRPFVIPMRNGWLLAYFTIPMGLCIFTTYNVLQDAYNDLSNNTFVNHTHNHTASFTEGLVTVRMHDFLNICVFAFFQYYYSFLKLGGVTGQHNISLSLFNRDLQIKLDFNHTRGAIPMTSHIKGGWDWELLCVCRVDVCLPVRLSMERCSCCWPACLATRPSRRILAAVVVVVDPCSCTQPRTSGG